MRPAFIAFIFIAAISVLSAPVHGQNDARDKQRLDERLQDASTLIDSLMVTPESSIPPLILAKARAVIIMQRARGRRFMAAKNTGLGIAIVRDQKTAQWRMPVFLESEDGFWGLRIGGKPEDSVFLLMDDRAMSLLYKPHFRLGVEITASVGPPASVGNVEPETSILVYAPTNNLMTGTFFESGYFMADEESNDLYFDDPTYNLEGLLFTYSEEPSAAARNFISTLQKYTANIAITKKKRIGSLIF